MILKNTLRVLTAFLLLITIFSCKTRSEPPRAPKPQAFKGEYVVRAQGAWCPSDRNSNQFCPKSGFSSGVHLVVLDEFDSLIVTRDPNRLQLRSITDADNKCDQIVKSARSNITCSPNYILFQSKVPNDSFWDQLWGLSDIQAPVVWNRTQGDEDLIAAVIDSGIRYDHPELAGKIHPASTSVIDGSKGEDDNGHGTHVAGTICANSDNGRGIAGVNWNCQILSMKFLTASGSGSTFHAVKAVDEVTRLKKLGANIVSINASWGGGGESAPLREAIRDAGDEGILFIAAAGNSALDNDTHPHFPSNYKLSNVVSVASIHNAGGLSAFSNFGKTSVHIAAPGSSILSLGINADYIRQNGTSMAAPHVTGASLLLKALYPRESMNQLRNRLLSGSRQVNYLKNKTTSGGKLDIAKAAELEEEEIGCKKKKRRRCNQCCNNEYSRRKDRRACKKYCALTYGCLK